MLSLRDDTFHRLAQLMHEAVGLYFGESKRTLVVSRLAPRLQTLALEGFDDYLALLAHDAGGAEFQVAVDLLTTNETYFFREPAHFDLLERELARTRPRSLSAWSAAASFGDEAFSLAMLLADLQLAGRIGEDWSVLATDISDRVLRTAVEAVYPQERLRNVTPERLRRYCLRGYGASEGFVMIQERLREKVHFGQLNLSQPFPDLPPFDVVFLRNVLIYFDTTTKHEVVDHVLASLRPGGLLFIGTAEGRAPSTAALEPLAPGVFRKPRT